MATTNQKIDKNVLRIVDLNAKQSDFAFWQTQPFYKRLEALETLRKQYIIWKHGSEQRFQRVYRIIELSQN